MSSYENTPYIVHKEGSSWALFWRSEFVRYCSTLDGAKAIISECKALNGGT